MISDMIQLRSSAPLLWDWLNWVDYLVMQRTHALCGVYHLVDWLATLCGRPDELERAGRWAAGVMAITTRACVML